MAYVMFVGVCDVDEVIGALKDLTEVGAIVFLHQDKDTMQSVKEGFSSELKAKVTSLETNQVAHGLFQLKCMMDSVKANDALVYSSDDLSENVRTLSKEVFPENYNLIVKVLDSLQFKPADCGLSPANTFKTYLSKLEASETVDIYKTEIIPDSFIHGYSSRSGGLSTFPGMKSLNMCFSVRKKDSRAVVRANHSLLAKAAGFDVEKFMVAKAVHGNNVWVYEKEPPDSYDAVVTNTQGVTVAAPGADCNMLLFADPVTNACGAAHAGWKGILKGVIQSTVTAMKENYGSDPKNIKVAIGPSLSVCCLEFGADGVEMFSPIHKDCVVLKECHLKPFIDLRLACVVLLQKAGIPAENIDESGLRICTKCDPQERFFSYRRVGPQFGNQVGFICMK